MNKQRQAKIDHEIQRILGGLIPQLRDQRIEGFVTVMRAEVSDDLQHCKVFVSIIGDREAASHTMEALQHASRFLRGELGHQINLRHTPDLIFIEDRSTEKAIALAQTLREDAERHKTLEQPEGEHREDLAS